MVIMIGLCLFWSRHDWNFSQLLLFEKLFSVRFPIVKEGAITGRKTNLPILTYLYFLYTNIHSKQNTLLTLFIKCIFSLYLLGFYVPPRTEIIKLWKNEIHKVCSCETRGLVHFGKFAHVWKEHCCPVWVIFKVLRDKFSYKSCLNIWSLLGLFWKRFFEVKTAVLSHWATFEKLGHFLF